MGSMRSGSATWPKYVAAGGKHFTFQDLRSVSADYSADQITDAQHRLGHTSPETTKRYYLRKRVRTKAKPVK
jgi:integrase